MELAKQFQDNISIGDEPIKLQRDMSEEELEEYKDSLRAQALDDRETPAQEFEEVARKPQRDMTESELADEHDRLREVMKAERERLELEQGNNIDLERD